MWRLWCSLFGLHLSFLLVPGEGLNFVIMAFLGYLQLYVLLVMLTEHCQIGFQRQTIFFDNHVLFSDLNYVNFIDRKRYLSHRYLSKHTTKPTIRRATSEDSYQPAHPRSLIRVFADRMCLLQPPGYPKRDERELLPYWVDVQADLSLCWSHKSYCRSCLDLL